MGYDLPKVTRLYQKLLFYILRRSGQRLSLIHISENSKVSTLADYLGEGRAFADKDSGDIVNGYVTGLKNVTVLPHALSLIHISRRNYSRSWILPAAWMPISSATRYTAT